MARSGLKKVVKTVKGKKGTVRRSYWVKVQGAASTAKKAVGGFARRHSTALKVVGGVAALAGLAYGAHKVAGGIQRVQKVRVGRQQAGRQDPMTARETASHFAKGFRAGSDVGKRVRQEAVHQSSTKNDPTYNPSLGRNQASAPIRAAAAAYNRITGAYNATAGARSAVAGTVAKVRGAASSATGAVSGKARSAGARVRDRFSRKQKGSPFAAPGLRLGAG